MFDSGLRHQKMPYLCGFADSMLQKVSKKVSKRKGGALELYSSKTKPEKYVVKNNDFIGQSHVGVLFLALDFVTSHTPLKTNITAMAWVNFNTPTPITSEAKTETMG